MSVTEHSLSHRILSGEVGCWAAPMRGMLTAVEQVYGFAMKIRNRAYDQGQGVCEVGVPVVSVGNLTVGGTGKTPMVIHIAERLERWGASPAVVARGYGAENGRPNDEERLIRARVPGIAYVADRDRLHGAQQAVDRLGADVILLDDGFQHRRLARNLDIVLVDALCPFGYDHLLPRGLLREPVECLRRADLVVMTRCDQVAQGALDRVIKRISGIDDGLAILKCRHAVFGVEPLAADGAPPNLDGLRVVAFAGIAQPRGFLTTLRSLGCEVVGQRWWPDHHKYRTRDIDELMRTDRFAEHDALITTEKDAVKLRALGGLNHANILVVCISIDFMDDGGTMLDEFLARVVAKPRIAAGSESAAT